MAEMSSLRMAERLWDCQLSHVFDKIRESKRTARSLSAFFTRWAALEQKYAKDMLKLAEATPIQEETYVDVC